MKGVGEGQEETEGEGRGEGEEEDKKRGYGRGKIQKQALNNNKPFMQHSQCTGIALSTSVSV